MPHHPKRHDRRSIRLKGYDYTRPGAYFITVCTHYRSCQFGHVVSGDMHLNEAGMIAQHCWEDIPTHFPRAALDAFVIMPNHIHGIIMITCTGEASIPPDESEDTSGTHASPLRQCPIGTQPGSLSAIVQNLKSISTRKINAARGSPGAPLWHRNYYEHVVRNENELKAIREYIVANPANWGDDENNPLCLD